MASSASGGDGGGEWGDLQVGGVPQQVGLPRQEDVVETGWIAAECDKGAARSDQGGIEANADSGGVTVGLEPILAFDFGLGQVNALGAGAAGQGGRISPEALANSGGERGGEAGLAFTEVNLSEDGLGRIALLDGEGDVHQKVVVADLKRRGV